MTERSLASRLAPVESPAIPADRAGVRWRPATVDDVDALLDAAREMDAADHPDYATTREEIADDFARSFVDPARDTLLAEDEDGCVLGYGVAVMPPDHDHTVAVHAIGGVRPSARGRGLGRAIIGWQRARGLEQLSASEETKPGWIQTYADDRAPTAHRALERAGFEVRRWFVSLERDLAAPIPDRSAPADLEVRSPTDEDEEAVRVARNAAFRDHWGSQPRGADDWALRWRGAHERHDLSSIAVDREGAVAAFVLVEVNPDDFPLQGFSSAYISLVGTLAAHRRRGLAATLLARTLTLAAAEGLQRAVLDVDSDSPTGAGSVYSGLGFAGDRRSRAYVLEV